MQNHADVYVAHVETPVAGKLLVRAARGRKAEGVLAGFHGYAEAAEAQLERLAAIPGADAWVLVSVEALNRFYRGRSEEVVASWMTRRDRDLAIAANVAYVNRAIDWVRRKYDLRLLESAGSEPNRDKGDSPLRVTVPLLYAGFSQGGAMAFRAAVRGAWRAAGVIAVGADVPPELLAGGNSGIPPVLLARGVRDDWYTQPKFEADLAALRARHVPVTAGVLDAGHEWTADCAALAGTFLQAVKTADARGSRTAPRDPDL